MGKRLKILDFTPEAIHPIPSYEYEEKWSRSIHPSINVREAEKDLEKVLSFVAQANQKIIRQDKDVFSYLVENTYELWFNKLNHNLNHNFEQWIYKGHNGVGEEIPDYNERVLFIVMNKFYDAAYGINSEEVKRWVERIDIFFTLSTFAWGVRSELFKANFDVELLRRFAKRETSLTNIMIVLEKGYTTDVVRLVNLDVLLDYTPEFVNRMLTKADPKTLSQLHMLNSRNRIVTEEVLENLVDAGFESDREVKKYARQFAVTSTARNYFERVIKAKKLYPVLTDYQLAV